MLLRVLFPIAQHPVSPCANQCANPSARRVVTTRVEVVRVCDLVNLRVVCAVTRPVECPVKQRLVNHQEVCADPVTPPRRNELRVARVVTTPEAVRRHVLIADRVRRLARLHRSPPPRHQRHRLEAPPGATCRLRWP